MRALLPILLIPLSYIHVLGQSVVDRSSIQEAVKRGHHFLADQQKSEGSFSDSLNNLFETWETILVTDALLYTLSPEDSHIQKAIQWLRAHESPEHLICHNQKCQQSYCLETSSVYLQLLNRVPESTSYQHLLAFIEKLQQKDGHWEIGNPDVTLQTGFPSVTAFVVNLFEDAAYTTENANKARAFLATTQLPDGSWGSTWEYYGCTGYALWQCLPALRNDTAYVENVERAKQFILSTQKENGSWHVISESVNHVSDELQTAFMLLALLNETDMTSKAAVEKGISFLLKQQSGNGSWDGGLFPIPNERYKKREYLVVTALTCKLLSLFEQYEWE